MRSKRAFIPIGIVTVLGIAMWIELNSNYSAAIPSIPWNISGKVIDQRSNGVPNVEMIAEGAVNVTFLNHMFGTKEKRFRMVSKSGDDGEFDLRCNSYSFTLLFQKPGFQDYSNYFYIGDALTNTNKGNQVIIVQLLKAP